MKNKILLFTMLAFLISACENWIIFEENEKPAQTQKKKTIAELKPKHRFSMPLEDVKNEKKNKKIRKTMMKYDIKDIVEVGKEVLKKFPEPTKDKDLKTCLEIILQDFPELTKEDIKKNDTLIAKYYAVNLDYEVLQVLKKTKVPKKEKKDVKLKLNIKDLTRPPAEVRDQHLALGGDKDAQNRQKRRELKRIQEERARRAAYEKRIRTPEYRKQRRQSITGCTQRQSGTAYSEDSAIKIVSIMAIANHHGLLNIPLWGQWKVYNALDWGRDAEYKYNNREIKYDAVKHLYWQMLLCKHYSPPFWSDNKEYRMDFARQVGELWEEYGENYMDDSVMDLHNNEVARNLWAKDEYSWDQGWWFQSIHSVDNHNLLQAARDKYHGKNKYKWEGGAQIVDKILGNYANKGDNKDEYNKYNWAYQDYEKHHYPYYNFEKKYKRYEEKEKSYIDAQGKKKKIKFLNQNPDFNDPERICYRRYWILNDADKNRPVELGKNQRERPKYENK